MKWEEEASGKAIELPLFPFVECGHVPLVPDVFCFPEGRCSRDRQGQAYDANHQKRDEAGGELFVGLLASQAGQPALFKAERGFGQGAAAREKFVEHGEAMRGVVWFWVLRHVA